MLTAAQLFERMCAWDDENYILGAGTATGQDTNDHDGIVDGHVFVTLSLAFLRTHNHTLTHSLSPVLVVVMGSMELKTSRSLMLIF